MIASVDIEKHLKKNPTPVFHKNSQQIRHKKELFPPGKSHLLKLYIYIFSHLTTKHFSSEHQKQDKGIQFCDIYFTLFWRI